MSGSIIQKEVGTKLGKVCHIKPIKESDLGCATSLLFQSYHDDPLFMEIFNADKKDYNKRLRNAISQELKVFWQAKEPTIGLFIDNQLLGVACIVCPEFGLSTGRFWHWRLKMLLTAGFVSTRQMIEKEEKLRAAVPFERYHMIAYLAVHPTHQKYGLGNILVEAVDELVKSQQTSSGVGVYITLEKYMDLFKGYDYEQVADVSVGYVHGRLLFRCNDMSLAQLRKMP